jgi:hypothetical protein
MRSNRPILVTGIIRSGSTWVGKTLSQHPRVRYVQEPFSVDHPNQTMGLKLGVWFTHYQSSNQREEIKASFDNLLQANALKYAVKKCAAAGMDIRTPLRFSKHLLDRLLLRPRILVKDPLALLSAEWLYKTYNFNVVVIIRNPFAVVGSMKKAGWDFPVENLRKQKGLMQGWLNRFTDSVESMYKETDGYDLIDRAALLWNALHFVILKYQIKYPEWLFIKYEDIAMNPEAEFRRIFDYLGLGINRTILDYIEYYTSPGNPKEATSTAYQPRDSRLSLHNWKERLSNNEIERVKTATSDIACQFYGDMWRSLVGSVTAPSVPDLIASSQPKAVPELAGKGVFKSRE